MLGGVINPRPATTSLARRGGLTEVYMHFLGHWARKDRTLVHLVVVAPEKMEERMEFVNAADMARSLTDTGRVALYGINFDTDKDTLRRFRKRHWTRSATCWLLIRKRPSMSWATPTISATAEYNRREDFHDGGNV